MLRKVHAAAAVAAVEGLAQGLAQVAVVLEECPEVVARALAALAQEVELAQPVNLEVYGKAGVVVQVPAAA